MGKAAVEVVGATSTGLVYNDARFLLAHKGVGALTMATDLCLFNRMTDIGRSFDQNNKIISKFADDLEPPGDCDPGRYSNLKAEVDEYCKLDQATKCAKGMPSDTLRINLYINMKCAQARDKINQICFKGGDKGHRNQAINRWNGVRKCNDILNP